MSADYDQLVGTLEAFPAQRIVVFPASHASYVSQITKEDVTPLAMMKWPASSDEIAEGVTAALPIGDRKPVDLVLVDEAHANPERDVLLALHNQCYVAGESWFGLLHLINCVTGPEKPRVEPIEGWYLDVIELKQGVVLDPSVHAGDAVRVVLVWKTTQPVRDEWRVYAHVMDTPTGTLQAQHDAIPGNGLLPMTSWPINEPITDRFAIMLPSWQAPGQYEVRIGIYHPVSGERLRVTAGREIGPDYVVAGHFEIVP
jgi:hypothetical protein